MSKRKVIELKNIGKTISNRLNEVGIYTEDDLVMHGAVKAHKMIKEHHPDTTLPLCYYLYSFDGALKNTHWDDIGEERKQELKKEIQASC